MNIYCLNSGGFNIIDKILQNRNVCIYLINRNDISQGIIQLYKNCVKLDKFAKSTKLFFAFLRSENNA